MSSTDQLIVPAAERAAAPAVGRLLRRLAADARVTRAIPVALTVVTFLAFSETLWHGFVEWDDRINFLDNQDFRGLGWRNIRWMFSTVLMGHYIPLTWLTFGLDYTLWGMKPMGYHLWSVVLHAVNAALMYFVALRLLGRALRLEAGALRLAAAATAFFFAVHPLRAESVAWATERRDVLSGMFFLLAVLAYLKAVDADGGRRRRLLVAVAGCFVLGLASKSMVMTLPLALIIMDFYPLRRLPTDWRQLASPAARAVWREKVPFLALGLLGAAVGYWAQASNHYVTSLQKYPPSARVGMVFYSYWFYLWKTIVPTGLSPLHELPATIHLRDWPFLSAMIAVLSIAALVLALRRALPGGLAAAAFYVVTLAPVSGVVHSGYQLTHDRYSYLPCMSWALLLGAAVGGLVTLARAEVVRPVIARLAAAALAFATIGLAILTWQQVQVWKDDDSLWRYSLETEPTCSICRTNLGVLLYNQGFYVLARGHFERVMELRPDRDKGESNLAITLGNLGEFDAALAHFESLLRRKPNSAELMQNVGVILLYLKRYDEALAKLQAAERLQPDQPVLLANIGFTYSAAGRPDRAVPYFERSLGVSPESAPARVGLALAYAATGREEQARAQWEKLQSLDGRLAGFVAPVFLERW
ncbi:MAG: tetratricopeptide repeat protein [Candidatus Rokubacteria bacterium]|nr:tetratricopeptide repeat protein [Candidatus Rokubacteria bacterium]MBI3825560.1 tetratricopeptide repeat protein [Candidatus Rokubacteria bacterium]